jgi:RHS repeat-associated protein
VTDTRYNSDGTVFSQTQMNWAYDNDGRLTNETLTVLNDGTGGTNANGHAPAAYSDTFKFDLDSNRVEQDQTGSQNSTITYTYNSDNELLTETSAGDGAYSTGYSYDNAGNLKTQTRTGTNAETDSYTWDLRGRMATATVNGVTTTYTYDSNGVRTSETTSGVTTYYLNDPKNPTGYAKAAEEWTSSDGNRQDATLSRSYVLGLQVEAQADSTNGVLFMMHDGHGSTRALLNVSGSIVEQYNYDAYGEFLASTGAQSNASAAMTNWLFAGDGEYDAGSQFTYQLARYRDRFRFVSSDDPTLFSPGDLANANLYAYAEGDSINVVDPSGTFSVNELLVNMGIGGVINGISSYNAKQPVRSLLVGFSVGAIEGALFYGAFAGLSKFLGPLVSRLGVTQVAASGFARITGAVGTWAGTLFPQSFTMSTKMGAVYVAESATKHIGKELLADFGGQGAKFAAGLVLESIHGAIDKAYTTGILRIGEPVVVDGWEIIVGISKHWMDPTKARYILFHCVPKSL